MRRLLFALGVAGAATVVPASAAPAATTPVTPDNFEIMLVVDTSGSMAGVPVQLAKEAAHAFVAQVPGLRVGVESFGSAVTVLTAPTADHGVVDRQIDALAAGGDTLLHDAVITATQSFTPAAEHKAIVLLSDGGDRGSRAGLDDAVAAVSGIHVEAISLTTSTTDLAALQALGPVTSADDPSGLLAAFLRVGGLITQVVVPTTLPPTTVAPTTLAPTTVATTAAAAPTTTAYQREAAPTASREASSWPLYAGAGAVFVALFSLTFIALPAVRVSRKRLGLPQRSVSKQAVTTLDDFLERHGHRGTLATRLSTADISMAPGEFVALVLAATVVLGFAGLVVAGPLVALVLAVLVVLLARTIVSRKANKRQATFADQLPDVLQLVTSSLRAGHGMTQALDAVAEEAEEPARSEFTHVLVETRLGRDLTDSLRNLASRMNSVDLDWVASAIDIHRETGGNLSEILTTVANTIRERQRMRRQIRTLTAEGRMSARVLTALPLLLALWQWRVHPESFDVLTHGGGLVLSALAAVLMVLGWFWINRLVRIKM